MSRIKNEMNSKMKRNNWCTKIPIKLRDIIEQLHLNRYCWRIAQTLSTRWQEDMIAIEKSL